MSTNLRLVSNGQPKKRQAAKPQAAKPEPPPQAEIILFSSLQGKRAAQTADLTATVHIERGSPERRARWEKGDMILMQTIDGGFTIAAVTAPGKNGQFHGSCSVPPQDCRGIIGRIVFTSCTATFE